MIVHLTPGDVSLEPDTGERFAALGWVDPAFNDLRALSERPADLLPAAVLRAQAENDPDVVNGSKLNESNLHVAAAIVDTDFAQWLCHQNDGDEHQKLILKRANELVLPASPTLGDLQDAVAGALDRDLLPSEADRLQQAYTDAGSALDTVILPDRFEYQWFVWCKEMSRNTNDDLVQRLQHDGLTMPQHNLHAAMQSVHPTALRGINTDLQHKLFQRAYLNLPASTIPSDAAILTQYKAELKSEAQVVALNDVDVSVDSFVKQFSITQHDVKGYKASASA